MKSILLILAYFSFSYALACPAFSFKSLTCHDKVNGQESQMKRFELVDRSNYQVLVSEVGPRFRTLVLPYFSQGRNGIYAELYCDETRIRLDQYFGDIEAHSSFEVNYVDGSVTQKGTAIRVSEQLGSEVQIHIVCKVNSNK